MSDDTDEPDAKSRNEITIRDYERKQLTEFLPDLVDLYEDRELLEKRDLFDELQELFAEPIDGYEATYDLGADTWRDLALALEELNSTRASWLRAKIGRRANLAVIHMGFTTEIPAGTLMTGDAPVRSD